MSTMPDELENIIARDRAAAFAGTNRGGGFEDISGELPKSDYFFEPGTEKSTRGIEIHNLETDVAVVAGREDIDLMHITPSNNNECFIKKTPKGHVLLFDDTVGSERILIKHKDCAGIEIKPDGSVIINARGNRVDLITGNHHLYTEGNGNLTYSGDLNMNIGGDFNLDIGGNYNLKVGGHWIVNIFGSYTKRIVGMMSETIQKVKNTTVLKDVTNTFLGKLSTSVKGAYEFAVVGEADYNHKGSTTLTSQTETTLTSPNINIVAQDLTLIGNTGTIGGENIVMFNYNMYTGHSITATDTVTTGTLYNTTQVTTGNIDVPVVNGDLKGTAEKAIRADVTNSQEYSASSQGSASSYTIVSNSTADTSVNTSRGPGAVAVSAIKQLPTSTTISTFIDKSAYMVQSVFVDDDDGIYNYLDKTVSTAGVTDRPLTTSEIRIKMRNNDNKANTSFVQECVSTGVLSSSHTEKVPPNIKRIVGKETQTRLGSKPIGASDANTKTIRYKAADTSKKSNKFLVPEAQYNPNNIKDIRMGTLLSPGIPVSKFFPNNETMNHLTQVERHRIARNLVSSVKLLKLIKTPKFMNGFNIKITEGVQKLGITDTTVANDSITKLSAIGRVVGFEIRNTRSGELSPEITFDLAAYLKDNAEYDKLILSYDTYEVDELSHTNQILYSSILCVMPEMPQNYQIVFKQNIETIFNDELQSSKDLIEIGLNDIGLISLDDPNKPSIRSDGLMQIKTKNGFHTLVSAAVWDNFQGFINELEGPKYNYKIDNLEGYSSTTQRYGNILNEYIGEDLWTANASGLAININYTQNLTGASLVHDFPAGISNIAQKYGLGWGGDFRNYKDASLFSIRDEEGGSISAPRSNIIYMTAETRKEMLQVNT